MRHSTKIDSINLREALVKNRRLLIARRVPGARRWVLPYAAMVAAFILVNGILVAVARLIAE